MNVASLELCKELYEVSGWEPEHWKRRTTGVHDYLYAKAKVDKSDPAYDLGYLLRKLPPYIESDGFELNLSLEFDPSGRATAEYRQYKYDGKVVYVYDAQYHNTADTPEDALCKLAIELFKQNVLDRLEHE